MPTPGFTAEAALYNFPRNYATAISATNLDQFSGIVPQRSIAAPGATPDTCYCCSGSECWEVGCASTCGFGLYIKWRCNETKCWKPTPPHLGLTF